MSEKRPPDAELVRAALGGDEEAFGSIVERHMSLAYSVALGVLGEATEAEDAAQESFLRVYRGGLAGFDRSGSFKSWIARIARNVSLNMLRKRRSRLAAERALASARRDEGGPRRGSERDASPAEEILEALMKLPENHRTALRLFHMEGLSYTEIAGTMDVPLGTVKTYIHRGREALRRQLLPEGS